MVDRMKKCPTCPHIHGMHRAKGTGSCLYKGCKCKGVGLVIQDASPEEEAPRTKKGVKPKSDSKVDFGFSDFHSGSGFDLGGTLSKEAKRLNDRVKRKSKDAERKLLGQLHDLMVGEFDRVVLSDDGYVLVNDDDGNTYRITVRSDS